MPGPNRQAKDADWPVIPGSCVPMQSLTAVFTDGVVRGLWGKVVIEGRGVEAQVRGWEVQRIR